MSIIFEHYKQLTKLMEQEDTKQQLTSNTLRFVVIGNEFLGKYVLNKFKLYNRLEVSFCLLS